MRLQAVHGLRRPRRGEQFQFSIGDAVYRRIYVGVPGAA